MVEYIQVHRYTQLDIFRQQQRYIQRCREADSCKEVYRQADRLIYTLNTEKMGVRLIGYGASRQTLTQLIGVKNFCDGEKFDFFLDGNKILVVWRKNGFFG